MAKGGYRGGMPMMGGMNQMQMMKQAQKKRGPSEDAAGDGRKAV